MNDRTIDLYFILILIFFGGGENGSNDFSLKSISGLVWYVMLPSLCWQNCVELDRQLFGSYQQFTAAKILYNIISLPRFASPRFSLPSWRGVRRQGEKKWKRLGVWLGKVCSTIFMSSPCRNSANFPFFKNVFVCAIDLI